jgi:simple sugar transport system permease protein
VPNEFLNMLPYLATIVAVAGLVGRVRAPAADGVPYVKS